MLLLLLLQVLLLLQLLLLLLLLLLLFVIIVVAVFLKSYFVQMKIMLKVNQSKFSKEGHNKYQDQCYKFRRIKLDRWSLASLVTLLERSIGIERAENIYLAQTI